MRVVDTDNFGGDYPDEKFVGEQMSREEAEALADKLNGKSLFAPRYYKVVPDDYILRPGFEP